jgi:hypothetical protein
MGGSKAMTATRDVIERFQEWYEFECNGDWEHQYGVRVQTLDNPGWAVDIDLTGTAIENRFFAPLRIDRSKADWVRCKVEDGVFKGRGGATNLRELVTLFLQFAEAD